MDDRHLVENVFNGFHFANQGSKNQDVNNFFSLTVSLSLLNNNVHYANVQEIPTFTFIEHLLSSVFGTETKILVSKRSKKWQ